MDSEKEWVSHSEYARRVNKKRQQIDRWCNSGRIPTNSKGLINPAEADKALANKNGTGDDDDGKPSYWDEQTRLAGHKADLAAMEFHQRAGELVEAAEVVAEYDRLFIAIRQRVLGQATKIAPLGANKSRAALFKIIDDENKKLLTELSQYNADTGKFGPPAPASKNRKAGKRPKAPAGSKRKRVGK